MSASRSPSSGVGPEGVLRLLICDDHALFREGLRYVLGALDPAAVLKEARDAEAALELLAADRDVDLVLLDLQLPGRSGLDALGDLRIRFPEVPVAIISASEDPALVRRVLAAGACGFIPKSSTGAVLRGALNLILAGGVYVPPAVLEATNPAGAPARVMPPREPLEGLTTRQREVLRLVARGLTNREIAGILGISDGTVKNHVAAILERLEISNRTEAAFVLRRLEDLDPI